jgi:hypothetical protein
MRGRHLQVVERSDGAHRPREHRIGGDVIDPPPRRPDFARRVAQPLDELVSASHRHEELPRR